MYVTLIEGKTYDVMGVSFVNGKEMKVDKKIAEYLKDNPQFRVSAKPTGDESEDAE